LLLVEPLVAACGAQADLMGSAVATIGVASLTRTRGHLTRPGVPKGDGQRMDEKLGS
jgi:hypothetical protein